MTIRIYFIAPRSLVIEVTIKELADEAKYAIRI